MNKALGVAALVIIAAFGLSIWSFGNARYAEGQADMKAEMLAAQDQSAKDGKASHEKKKQELHRIDDADLVRRYCVWVFDMPYNDCIRTVAPIP